VHIDLHESRQLGVVVLVGLPHDDLLSTRLRSCVRGGVQCDLDLEPSLHWKVLTRKTKTHDDEQLLDTGVFALNSTSNFSISLVSLGNTLILWTVANVN
jgi:hypothetical protein